MAFLFKSKNKQSSALPPTSRNVTSADESSNVSINSGNGLQKEGEKPRLGPTTPTGFSGIPVPPVRGVMSPSLGIKNLRERNEQDTTQSQRSIPNPTMIAPQRPTPDLSLYPWSQRRLDFVSGQSNPFPRYGAAVNSVASKEGDIYLMGGLINGSTVKGDLWIVEAASGNLNCYPVPTTAEGPGPRVGHASLLVGNAFIVFGGDTKIDESDLLDDTLYLLNTSTKHWSRALPAGQRPSGRYGHTLNILGSKIYIFGGQVEGYFFNDLVAFDLNGLQAANSRWEILVQNTNDGGPPLGQSPPARTNHTIITWNDKLYLFGGTDGVRWFNDVWTYDPRINSWSSQECIGFIPAAREGHAAALVGDVMYVFGGRTEEGKDLGDLAAFRITTRRWYTFQNMGPSPSPRSGHGLTAFGNEIYVLAGEPSSAPRDPGELSLAYILDTAKIRYPSDQGSLNMPGQRQPGSRRPSTGERSGTPQDRSSSRDGSRDRDGRDPHNGMRKTSLDSMSSQQSAQRNQEIATGNGFTAGGPLTKLLRPGITPAPSGPPPRQQAPQPKMNGVRPTGSFSEGRESPNANQKMDRAFAEEQSLARELQSTMSRENNAVEMGPPANIIRGQYSPPRSPPQHEPYNPGAQYNSNSPSPQGMSSLPSRSVSQRAIRGRPAMNGEYLDHSAHDGESPRPREEGQQSSGASGVPQPVDSGFESSPLLPGQYPVDSGFVSASPPPRQYPLDSVTESSALPRQYPVDSGLGSSPAFMQDHYSTAYQHTPTALNQQSNGLVRELEDAKSKVAWYASELTLARKAGYRSSTNENNVSEDRSTDSIGDDEKPMLEALLRMRSELVRVQESLESQSMIAAQRIAQVEKEKDAAIYEAVYAKTRSAARGWKGEFDDGRDARTPDSVRSGEVNHRLASALASQNEFSTRISTLQNEVETERKARLIAEEASESAHSRVSELDMHKQQNASELERLRSELHEAQKFAREEAANAAEATASSNLLQVDKNELNGKLSIAHEEARNHINILSTLREAVTASSDKALLYETKWEHEKRQCSSLEEKLGQLRAEHETSVSELETTTKRLQDAEELSESHATEARTHRQAVLAGLGKINERNVDEFGATDERVGILQQQVEAANSMVRRNQDAADQASEKLRRAEERIAGLEAYQEQTSREGLGLRKQLQAASRETLSLHSENADLQQQLASQRLDSTALQVQHGALKDLLGERGIDFSEPPRSRASDGSNAANIERFRDLEQQLEASNKAHEEMRSSFERREQDANRSWEDKLAALDNDYQSAVKYLKGTEKMLSKMKQELYRYKSQNKELEEEVSHSRKKDMSNEWERERTSLRTQIDEMQARIQQSAAQLDRQMQDLRSAQSECDTLRESSAHYQQQLQYASEQSRNNIELLRSQNHQLEIRAADAERKVQVLLETVGNSVSNYRRESHSHPSGEGSRSSSNTITGGIAGGQSHSYSHNRDLSINSINSIGGDSVYSGTGTDGANDEGVMNRNSIALDSLASELDILRSHWETTNKNYRLSDRSDLERSFGPPSGGSGAGIGGSGDGGEREGMSVSNSLAVWRRRLEEEEREGETNRSRGSPRLG